MEKEIYITFSTGEKLIKRAIDFLDSPPISLFAIAQNAVDIAWLEKMALRKRIEELESEVAKLNEIIDSPIDLSGD